MCILQRKYLQMAGKGMHRRTDHVQISLPNGIALRALMEVAGTLTVSLTNSCLKTVIAS